MYISFYHGRKEINEQMNDWGFQGPIVGPVSINWTYGTIKIVSPDGDEFIDAEEKEGLIRIAGNYYGDFSIIDNEEAEQYEQEKILAFDQFKALSNWK